MDLYDFNFSHFTDQIASTIRSETFGEDIGQDSWLTVDELGGYLKWVSLMRPCHVLDVASGSGGLALFLARRLGCHVTGLDLNPLAIDVAHKKAVVEAQNESVHFEVADGNQCLPHKEATFDNIMCIDSIYHFRNRLRVLKEWYRVLKPLSRILFTDPAVITGPLSSEELAVRSVTGFYMFFPAGLNECLIREAGFRLLELRDVTMNMLSVSVRWHDSRERHRDELLRAEGESIFNVWQRFFKTVQQLAEERRLSRFVYLAEKPVSVA